MNSLFIKLAEVTCVYPFSLCVCVTHEHGGGCVGLMPVNGSCVDSDGKMVGVGT